MKEYLGADKGKTECGGQHRIKVEKSERKYQKVCLVDLAEMHCACSGPFHPDNPGRDHSEAKYQRQRSHVSLHQGFSCITQPYARSADTVAANQNGDDLLNAPVRRTVEDIALTAPRRSK